MDSPEELEKRIFQFPTSQILLDKKKSSYYEVINSLNFTECNKAVCRIARRIDMNRIADFIKGIEGITETRKRFYITMLQVRYEKMIQEPYQKMIKTDRCS